MKIAIIGYSGSGKSTLARTLGACYGAPVLHLDKVQFVPGWQLRDREEAQGLVAAFMRQDSWVIDGNYAAFFQEERLAAADRIVFMDFPRLACFFRALKRYCKHRNGTRADMAEGCIEKWTRSSFGGCCFPGAPDGGARTSQALSSATAIRRPF